MSYSAEVMADSPSGYWRLADASGTTITDSSGNAHHGTYSGGYTLGEPSLLASDTGDDCVGLSRNDSAYAMTVPKIELNTNSTNGFTLEFLLRVTSLGALGAAIFKAPSANSSGDDVIISMSYFSGDAAYRLSFSGYDAGTLAWVVNSPTFQLGDTVHVIARAKSDLASITIDGVTATAVPAQQINQASNTDTLWRLWLSYNSANVVGWLDELSIYQSYLSDARADAHYSATLVPISGDLDAVGVAALVSAVGSMTFQLPPNPRRRLYRLTLTGAADSLPDVDLPMSSWQATTRLAEPDYLSAVVPMSAAIEALITARPHGTLIVRMGIEYATGTIWIAQIAAPLDSVRIDQGARSASITLVGYAANALRAPKTITPAGVSYRAAQHNGETRIRCAIDPFARPGDTIDYAGGFVADSITYVVGVRQAYMEATSG